MNTQTIQIETPDGAAEAYVSRPDADPHPGVLFYIDAIGLRPRIEEMADRIAAWGYVVLVPNVFHRDGRVAELAPKTDLRVSENRAAYFVGAMRRVRAHTPEQARSDLDAYLATMAGLTGMAGADVGATGYCMGGRLALRAASSRPDLVAAVGSFHAGGLVTEAADSPHRLLSAARAEIVVGHADRDRSNPSEAIAALDEALEASGLTYTTEVFAGAPHGFTMSDTSSYDEGATERSFEQLEALLDRTIKH